MTQADTPADSGVITEVETITDTMIDAGMYALRTLDLKNPVYSNRQATVRAIYEDMRLARPR